MSYIAFISNALSPPADEGIRKCASLLSTIFSQSGIYAISLFYYLAMIYGGQFLDVSLVWKLFIWIIFHWLFLSYDKVSKVLRYLSLLALLGGLTLGFYNLWLFLLG